MDEALRSQLNALAQKQADLQAKLRQLGEESKSIDNDLRELFQPKKKECSPATPNFEQLTEVIEAQRISVKSPTSTISDPPKKSSPSQLPPPITQTPPTKSNKTETGKTPSVQSNTAPIEKKLRKKEKPAKVAGEWEIDFGRVWLVRIGILSLLTGLIFLSTYAYKNWLFNAGASIKASFFMVISLGLVSLGIWLEKKNKRFQQYGRVVTAGGLAAGYYTIYATYFTPSLKLIGSPILAGLLLTTWAGGMLAFAIWKKSRIVAVMAIGLAFYGTIVNPAGWLSLFSALLLSSAGIWLMMKFKWLSVGFGTMAAAYIAHAFWLGGAYPQSVSEMVRFTYLGCYWGLFTVALAMPQSKTMSTKVQRTFCAINNMAAWQLAVFLIPEFTPHFETGWISIGIGGLLLSLASLTHWGKIWHKSLIPIFAYQGIFLLSFGILIEASGYTRFLLLAVEACLLLTTARYSISKLLRYISGGLLLCALYMATPEMNGYQLVAWQSYTALALICAVYTTLLHLDVRRATAVWGDNPEFSKRIPVLPALVTWLVLGYGAFGQWPADLGFNGLWGTTTLIIIIYFITKKPTWLHEIALTSPIAALATALWSLLQSPMQIETAALPLFGAAMFWYICPHIPLAWDELFIKSPQANKPSTQMLNWLFSLSFWLIAGITLNHLLESFELWLILGGILALAGHAVGELTRRCSIALPGLFFHLVALAALVFYNNQNSLLGWAPSVLLLLHLALVDMRWNIFNRGKMYIPLALGLITTVGIHSVRIFTRPELAITALGICLITWAWHRKSQAFAMIGGVIPLSAACLMAIFMHGSQDILRYLPIFITLIIHALLWLHTQDKRIWKSIRVYLLASGLICLFLTSSIHVTSSFHGSGLAICWSLLAGLLFTIGLMLHCRPYRLVGLLLLSAAVLHILFIDVMKLDTLGRILSFITLGLVLLALGFLYNRFQETIRKFL